MKSHTRSPQFVASMVVLALLVFLAIFILLGEGAAGNQALAAGSPPTITSGPTVTSIQQTTATFSWATSTATDGGVHIGASSGGPYTVSATKLSPKSVTHSITPATGSLNPGTTYYYYVESCDIWSQCVQSSEGSFTTASRPDLALGVDNIYWADMAAYNAGNLSIDYSVINNGGDDAFNAQVVGTSNSNLVLSLTAPFIGDIPVGGVGNMTIEYYVPQGVAGFSNVVSATAEDQYGNSYGYPGP